MTPYEKKQVEGARIMPLMGAVGALPAAGLATQGPAGAPLFALAICLVAASYAFWVYTDGIYYNATHRQHLTVPLFLRMIRAGTRYQMAMMLYGTASVALTMLGFTGQHSTLSTGVSVNAGFVVAGVIFACVVAHVLWSFAESNAITKRVRHELNGPDDEGGS